MKLYKSKTNFGVPFPQANDIYKLIHYIDIKISNKHEKSIFSKNIRIVERQVDYYISAARYLDLFTDEPTTLAKHIFSMNYETLLKQIVYLILSKHIFYQYFIIRNEEMAVNYLMEKYDYSKVTAIRRFSTLHSWIKWCDIVIQDYNLNL